MSDQVGIEDETMSKLRGESACCYSVQSLSLRLQCKNIESSI
jgi:hypothetical protein